MFHECRIYSPEGELKEVLSPRVLIERMWRRFEEREISREPGRRKKGAGGKVQEETKENLRRIYSFIAQNPNPDNRGWTLRELIDKLNLPYTGKALEKKMQSAHKSTFIRARFNYKRRPGARDNEYWIDYVEKL